MLKLYDELASWWPLFSPLEDYADEAAFFLQVMSDTGSPPPTSLLELGSGGGNNAFYFKQHLAQVTLTDLSPQMLAVSRALNPECQHLVGDMQTLRLGSEFDVVFLHDAIDYMTTLPELRRAMETAFIHCRPGGVALFVPDHLRETFEPSTDHGGHNGDERALRYLEWMYDPDEDDTHCVTEYVYVLREGNQPPRIEHEQHIHGLFFRADWLRLLQETGFQTEIICDKYDRELFVSRKPKS